MGTELMRVCIKEENDEIPSVPPGFESYASFTLKRTQDSDNAVSCSVPAIASESQSVQMKTEVSCSETTKVTRSRRHRPWVNYGQFDNCSEDEDDPQKLDQNVTLRLHLPKGVTRGCTECGDCQKVTARWRPADASRPALEDAPVFFPNEEEFEDTLKYIASIRQKAEPYGICRIVPPPSWKPPCPLKDKAVWESSTFATRVQRVDKLQNRDSMRKMSRINNQAKKKRRRCMRMGVDCGPDSGNVSGFGDTGFGFEPGPEFSLNTFQKYADYFKSQYFSKNEIAADLRGNAATFSDVWEPSVENIEGEYWRIVERATEEIEVLYGADLETGAFGSGFPKMSGQDCAASNERYIKSGWNLNNFPRLSGSVLSYESGDISGVLVPWLYIGMCFSSFCWHVEDHHLYSLNYMHWGAPKMWYGVPGKDALKLEEAMKKRLPDLFEEQPDLLHKLVTQLSPSILKSEGVPVYRCVQNAGEFVLTFPRAYHSGFNCGFNCAEAVNVAPVDWLPHGQIAIELYRAQGRKTSISHDKLLLGAAREAVRAHWELNLLKKNTADNLIWKDVCGKNGILTKTLRARVETERVRREFLCSSSQALKMESNFDATDERECSVCFFDLHLSAAGCHCSPDRYACLSHAKQLCSCPWGAKFFLFRYDICELNILIEALEGKLSAVYRWARLDLGLALSAYVSKGNMQVRKLSPSLEDTVLREVSLESATDALKNLRGKEFSRDIPSNSTGNLGEDSSEEKIRPSEALSLLKDAKASFSSHNSSGKVVMEDYDSKLIEASILLTSKVRTMVCQFSREDTSYAVDSAAEECAVKKPPILAENNIILLSDDEDDDEQKPVSEIAKDNSSVKHSELSERLAGSYDTASPSNHIEDQILTTPVTNAAGLSQKDVSILSDARKNDSSSPSLQVKDGHEQNGGPLSRSNPPNVSYKVGSSGAEIGKILDSPSKTSHDSDYSKGSVENWVQMPQPCGTGKPNNGDKHEKVVTNATSNLAVSVRTNVGSPSSSQNNLDRRQKGPRIAKVVRRINCNVEPLEYGTVLSGKLWCNSQAIFPKGFKSRVRYISIMEPTSMCYYVSEILDAGRDGPLFMVSLEHCPSEVFIHMSAARCWEMVRDRVNQEITKQHKLGRMNLPPLQPPGSLDGFEMFGFSSPAIVQAIEAIDRNRVCAEYWDSRPYSRPQVQIPQHSESKESGENFGSSSGKLNDGKTPKSQLFPVGSDTTLRGLFKKANLEELHSLCSLLKEDGPEAAGDLVTRLLSEEIQNRPT